MFGLKVANGEIEKAKKLIDSVKPKYPFDEKNNQISWPNIAAKKSSVE